MPSTIFAQRAHQFAEELGDDAAAKQIASYLRQSDCPGPVVAFVGAKGRGKSTLTGKAATVTLPLTAHVGFVGAGAWKNTVHEMAVADSFFLAAESKSVGDVLLCDSPAFDLDENEVLISALLGRSDLAVTVVQINQPAGAGEVEFVRKYLNGIPSVLVLTKCDQADGEDFQEGLEAVLDVYGDFPWVTVLLSGLDDGEMDWRHDAKQLVSFEDWWHTEGQTRAEEARRAHLERLGLDWRQRAKKVLDDKDFEFAPLLEAVRDARSVSSMTAQAYRLQDELMDGLRALPEKAIYQYRRHIADVQLSINQCANRHVEEIKSGLEVNAAAISGDLSKIYQDWDHETRARVRDEMKPLVEQLHKLALKYEECVRAATKTEASSEMLKMTKQREDAVDEHLSDGGSVELRGEFELTVSDKIRSTAMPIVSALGTGFLLFNVISAVMIPLAIIPAIIGGGMIGNTLMESNSEANRRKLASNLSKAINDQSMEQLHTLQQRFSSEWLDFSYGLRESVAASKRRLDFIAMRQSPNQDSHLASQDAALVQSIRKVEALRRDLRWLEEHNRSGKLIGEE